MQSPLFGGLCLCCYGVIYLGVLTYAISCCADGRNSSILAAP